MHEPLGIEPKSGPVTDSEQTQSAAGAAKGDRLLHGLAGAATAVDGTEDLREGRWNFPPAPGVF